MDLASGRRRYASVAWGLFATVVGVAACQAEPTPSLTTIGPRDSDYYALAWLEDGIVVSYEPDPENPTYELWRVPETSEPERIALPARDDCFDTRYYQPTALGGERLGFVQQCIENVGGPTYRVAALDSEGEIAVLGDVPTSVSQFVWLESQGHGLAGVGCGTLVWFGPDGSSPVDLTIEAGDVIFNNADQYGVEGFGQDCGDHGRADRPTANADETKVAFFASPPGSFTAQFPGELPWNLYVLDLETMTPTMLLSGISEPRALDWAPADDRLVFMGEISGHGDGTWLLRVSDPEPQQVLDERLDWIAWSPDGLSIAGLLMTSFSVEQGLVGSDIVIIEVPAPE